MRSILPVSVCFLAAMLATPAHAHAFLDHAAPKVGSTVAHAPRELRLWFTEALEPAFSSAQVRDGAKRRVDSRDTHVDPNDPAVLIVPVPPLPAGTYTVTWRVVARDTHRTEGHFAFTVSPHR
ncbi:MAG: copper resistance CopC family protein [Opitutaceae bacterium]